MTPYNQTEQEAKQAAKETQRPQGIKALDMGWWWADLQTIPINKHLIAIVLPDGSVWIRKENHHD